MWAQLITMRLKPGKEGEVQGLVDLMRATEQPGSGLVRSLVMRDENDPSRVCTLVVFESEERARARERCRTPGTAQARAGGDGRHVRRPSRVRRPDGRGRDGALGRRSS